MCVEEWGLNSSFYTDIDLLAIYTVDSIYHSKVDKISRDVIDNCISFFVKGCYICIMLLSFRPK